MKRWLLFSLFILIVLAPGKFGPYLGLGTGLSVKNLFLYIFVLVIGIRAVLSPNGIRFSDLDVHAAILVFTLFTAVSFTVKFAFDPTYPALAAFIQFKSHVIDYYLLFLVFRYGVDTYEDALWLFKAIVRTLLLLGVLVTIDYLNVPDLHLFPTHHGRAEGFVGEANQYAAFLIFSMPLLFVAIGTVIQKRRLFWWGTFVLTVLMFAATGSRGGYFGAILGFPLAVWFLRRHIDILAAAKFTLLGVAGMSLLMVVAVVLLGLDFIGDRIDLIGDGRVLQEYEKRQITGLWYNRVSIWLDNASAGRWSIWTDHFTIMLRQPWSILIGLGWMTTLLSGLSKTPHSEYIFRLYETGALGLIAFMAPLMVLVFRTRTIIGRLSGYLREIQIAYVLGLCGLLVAILAVQVPAAWPLIWAITGVVLAMQGHVFDEVSENDVSPVDGGDSIEEGMDGNFSGRPLAIAERIPASGLPRPRNGLRVSPPFSSRKRS